MVWPLRASVRVASPPSVALELPLTVPLPPAPPLAAAVTWTLAPPVEVPETELIETVPGWPGEPVVLGTLVLELGARRWR